MHIPKNRERFANIFVCVLTNLDRVRIAFLRELNNLISFHNDNVHLQIFATTYLDIGIATIAFVVNGSQILALDHVNFESTLLVVVLHAELDLTLDGYRSVATFAGARVDAGH